MGLNVIRYGKSKEKITSLPHLPSTRAHTHAIHTETHTHRHTHIIHTHEHTLRHAQKRPCTQAHTHHTCTQRYTHSTGTIMHTYTHGHIHVHSGTRALRHTFTQAHTHTPHIYTHSHTLFKAHFLHHGSIVWLSSTKASLVPSPAAFTESTSQALRLCVFFPPNSPGLSH